MKIYNQKTLISPDIQELKSQQYTIGLVPTMGALHHGHLALVKKALDDNHYVVVSIFVNPTQFDNINDLSKYPRTLNNDLELLKTCKEDNRILVYAPSVDDIYNGHIISQDYEFGGIEFEMEGRFRKGHFNGVGTIVKRLFDILKPTNAYFGEKDFQQLQIVKALVKTYDIPVNIIGCKIQRERDGLAMSSRNSRLTENYRAAAPFIYKILKTAKIKFGTESANKITEWVENQFANHDLLKLEYFIIADTDTLKPVKRKSNKKSYRAFIAVYADDIRLIDNIALN